ncbi:MAG: hypothetical protein EBT55_05605, partial [Proteobacteria bacterium]|nr:hypothetical protein [Pseudomonadota bacterium]
FFENYFFMKKIQFFAILALLFVCNCAKILTDAEKTAKNSSASTRINNSQSNSQNTLHELD